MISFKYCASLISFCLLSLLPVLAFSQSKLPLCRSAYKTNCVGEFLYTYGTRFIGEFKDNAPYGKGKFFYTNGLVYEGQVEDDSRHGKGILYKANGDVWQEGELT